jgi:hypothetical protein
LYSIPQWVLTDWANGVVSVRLVRKYRCPVVVLQPPDMGYAEEIDVFNGFNVADHGDDAEQENVCQQVFLTPFYPGGPG